jgi:hypothetical protein
MRLIALSTLITNAARHRLAIVSKFNFFDFGQKYRDRWDPRA